MKIAIDIDEVLAEFVKGLLKYHNKTFNTHITFGDVHSYNLWQVWGGTEDEAWEKFDKFYETPEFAEIEPIKSSQESVKQITKTHQTIVITSRPSEYKPRTLEWLNKHFPNYFERIRFTDEFRGKDNGLSRKFYLCQEEKTDIILEDSAKIARDCSRVCKKVILFNKPWNRMQYTTGNTFRVDTWEEALNQINDI